MTTVPEMLSDSIKKAFDLAQKDNLIANVEIGDTAVERPQNPGHGDYASSLPLKLAKPLKKNPMEIANVLAEYLKKDEILETLYLIFHMAFPVQNSDLRIFLNLYCALLYL